MHDDDFNDNDAGDHEYDDYGYGYMDDKCHDDDEDDDDYDDDVLKRMLISGWDQGCQEGGLCLTITRPRRVLVSIKHAPRLFTCEWISNTNLYISFIFYSNHVVKISK